MLSHFDVIGYLPIWPLWGHETHAMIGNHAIPVIVDAYMKGIRGYDVNKAYEAIKTSSTVNHLKSDWDVYLKYGYLPSDIIKEEAVSCTLESGIDDWRWQKPWVNRKIMRSLPEGLDFTRIYLTVPPG
jgi:putative alpha-1,2-mannosidase